MNVLFLYPFLNEKCKENRWDYKITNVLILQKIQNSLKFNKVNEIKENNLFLMEKI